MATANYVLKTNGSGQLAWAPDNNSDAVTKITRIWNKYNSVTPATGAKVTLLLMAE